MPRAGQEDRGLVVPAVEPKSGDGRRVLLKDSHGEVVVGKIYLDMVQRYVVLLPDGRMTSVKIEETTPTERPFQPYSKDELARRLTEADGPFPGFKSRSTARYVYVYNTSEGFSTATSRILETMYSPLVAWCKRAGLEVQEPETPMVVVMFANKEQLHHYWEGPEGMLAFYNAVNNYTVMYEPAPGTTAYAQVFGTIAHEGVHQILANIGVQQRLSRWPLWFSEGMAEYFAPTETGRRIRWKGVGMVNDVRLRDLSGYVQQRGAANLAGGALVGETVGAEALDAAGYAKSWALVHFLERRRRDAFQAYLADVAGLKGFAQDVPDKTELFQKHFGDNFDALQQDWFGHLRTLR
ncbi:MAG: DUF1570 domain-containing protein [Pirellulaceae bacterium]